MDSVCRKMTEYGFGKILVLFEITGMTIWLIFKQDAETGGGPFLL